MAVVGMPSRIHMKHRPDPHDPAALMAANDQVRANVQELMTMHRMTQAELAALLRKGQPWLSKRLTGTPPFTLKDLDAFLPIFGLSPAQLLQPGYGNLDRRSGHDRRDGHERRHLGERFDSVRGKHRIVSPPDHEDDHAR
jgi:transcriptional regulator with XRE-family HTH domain